MNAILERLKQLVYNPVFWSMVGGLLILFIRQLFPVLPLEDADLWKLFAVFVFTVFGIQIEVQKVMLRNMLMGKK